VARATDGGLIPKTLTSSSLEKKQARRAELVRRLSELAPKKRADALLETVDGRALVRSIPAEDVYATLVEVGLADASEVVQLGTVDQFRTWVDLASWQKDRVDPLEVLAWLRAARGEDELDYLDKLKGLDLELVELIYKRLAVIHDLEENPDANPEGVSFETPEGKFLVEFKVEGADLEALRRLTDDLMSKNPFELARFLEAVRHESSIELEEAAFQFRQARLQDLGFPPLDEAVKLFAFSDPARVTVATPTPGLAPPSSVDFVDATLRSLDAHERAVLEAEVRYLVNTALVAEGAEPGDPQAIRRVSEQARDWVNLGLEHLCGGDPARAADVVREHTLKKVFQVGFSLTLLVKRKAEAMAQEQGARFADTWLAMDEETQALQALLRKRPLKAIKVPGAQPLPFRFRRELADTELMLERVRAQRQVFLALLGSSPAEVIARFGMRLQDLTPQRLFAAAVARLEVGEPAGPAPFPALKLTELCARIFEGEATLPGLRAGAGDKAKQALAGQFPAVAAEVNGMIDRVFTAFLTDFGAAWVRDLKVDPKKVLALPIEGELLP
jgi:Family of unknown function (DUF6178)